MSEKPCKHRWNPAKWLCTVCGSSYTKVHHNIPDGPARKEGTFPPLSADEREHLAREAYRVLGSRGRGSA